jgi:hypothetical protein
MKNLFYILGLIISISACDVINGDVLESPGTGTTIDTTGNDTLKINFDKKVLIEEFTGHTCGNCPGGSRIVSNLKENANYEGRIVSTSIHAGSLADPEPDFLPKPEFKTDFRTSIGNELDGAYGVSLTGIPRGLVGRTGFDGSKLILPGTFESAVQDLIANDLSSTALVGNISYDESGGKINATITSHFREDINEDVNLTIYVTEDSVIDWQKNYASTGDPLYPVGNIPEYVHMHVFRGSMNGAWGDLLNESSGVSLTVEDEIIKSFSFTPIEGAAINNYNVVAFVSMVSNDEVIQVNEWHLKDYMN